MNDSDSNGLARTVGLAHAGGADAPGLRAGDRFGPFRLVSLLGRGAMGEVYQAVRLEDGAVFALKVISSDLMRDDRAVARFRQEARTLCALHSANIVSAEQVGEAGGRQWLAMQLCEGVRVTGADGRPRQARSLDEYVAARGGLLAQSVLLTVLDNILCGLAYAHDQGLVHRDLKPANILLARAEKGPSFRALISDFGLVRIVGEERVRERVEHSIGLSLTRGAAGDEVKAWLGNWAYMSPEQKRGQPATKASDLYAVGLLAYRLGTGKDLGLEAASELNPDLVPEWDAFIGQALEERPEHRYADAHAMRAALAAIHAAWERRQASRRGEEQVGQARRVRASQDKRVWAFVGAVVAGAMAIAGFFFMRESRVEGERPAMVPPDLIKSGAVDTVLGSPVAERPTPAAPTSAVALAVSPPEPSASLLTNRAEGRESGAPREEPATADASEKKSAPSAGAAAKEAPWVNSLGMPFVPVPGTDTLFCVWPARVQDFEAFVKEAGYQATTNLFSIKGSENWANRGDSWEQPGFAQGPTHPVVGVTWYDANAFCAWLTRKEQSAGLLDASRVYRLPTEAEWSLAEGPTNQSAYAWGNQWPPPPDGGNFAGVEVKGEWPSDWGVIEGYRDDYPRTAPVGCFAANAAGLYDMAGNVGQWCADWVGGRAVWRGSSWYDFESRRVKVGARNGLGPRVARTQTGFRVVLGVSASRSGVTTTAVARPAKGVKKGPTEGAVWRSPATGMDFVWIAALKMWAGKYEVTNEEYRKKVPERDSANELVRRLSGGRQPAVFVTFSKAVAYAKWLTEQDRDSLGGWCYRVPSETEWLAFARCGDGRQYPWGNAMPPKWGNYSDSGRVSGYSDGCEITCPVESSGANSWGLYGVGGNVWECCASDASGLSFGAWRGASWNTSSPGSMLCAFRNDFDGESSDNGCGFRLVLSPDESAQTEAKGGASLKGIYGRLDQ